MTAFRIARAVLLAGFMLASGAGLAHAQPLAGSSGQVTQRPCPPAFLYVVPGSEQGNSISNLGVLTNSVAQHLISDLGGTSKVRIVTVPYPAVPVWEAVDNAGGVGVSYLASRAAGVAALGSLISAQLAGTCAGSAIAIVGDHQGADVVANYVQGVSDDVASRFAGVALISDPLFNPADTAVDTGSFNPALPSLFPRFGIWTGPGTVQPQTPRPLFSGTLDEVTISVCNALDPVCNYSTPAGQVCFGPTTWLPAQAAISAHLPVLLPFALPTCPGILYGLPGSTAITPGDQVNTAGVAQYLAGQITQFMSWQRVSAGGNHTCGIRNSGTLWCWGDNSNGQLGIGNTISQDLPELVGTANDWGQVSAGGSHTCAIDRTKALYCWGANADGQLGLGNTTDQTTPQQVGSGQWQNVSAGGSHTCADRVDVTLWCWGDNADGQLGIGNTTSQDTPQEITGFSPHVISAGGSHTCATKMNNSLWCWGANADGQLGIGNTTDQDTPQQVGALTGWTVLSAGGSHTCSVRTGALLYCWGDNADGQLGIGNTTNQDTPQQVGTTVDSWVNDSAGGSHTCAQQSDQSLWCWGDNSDGQLGIGSTISQDTPQLVSSPGIVGMPDAGGSHTCALRQSDMSLRCWGDNADGQLGVGDFVNRTRPTPVT